MDTNGDEEQDRTDPDFRSTIMAIGRLVDKHMRCNNSSDMLKNWHIKLLFGQAPASNTLIFCSIANNIFPPQQTLVHRLLDIYFMI